MTQSSAPNLLLVTRPNPAFDLTRVEEYLEVVYELMQKKGYARGADIAQSLGVKSPSVTVMLQKLHATGFIVYERYRGLTLTNSGERLARSVQQRHLTILKFLRILGIEEKTAKSDTEGIEHHVHRATVDRLARFADYAVQHPTWFRAFEGTLR
ncbi:MAG: iron dependent repressor, metal binding and dimerization domain protein [Candidatus Bathyarchaeia archaeon]